MQKFKYDPTVPTEEIFRHLTVDQATGLSLQEVEKRTRVYGKNTLEKETVPTFLKIFIAQFKDLMIGILLLAAIISAAVGDVADTIAILVILLLNALIGAYQEQKAFKALNALAKLTSSHVQVIRDAQLKEIDAQDLLPGDIIKIEAGQVIAADIRLIENNSLVCDESSLTGESFTVTKDINAKVLTNSSLGDHAHSLYRGVTAVKGRGMGIVVAIGESTEMGKISKLARESTLPKTPLTIKLNQFSRRLSYWLLIVCTIVFALGWLRGEELLTIFMTAITLAVAAIPEALPAVVSVTLAMGARQMAKHKALVKNLKAVETLGSVDIICTDKTGTLTENRMHVESFKSINPASEDLMFQAGLLCHDVHENGGIFLGDPTEVAIVKWANTNSLALEKTKSFKRIGEIPFDSQRKLMSVQVENSLEKFVFTKGAPEAIVSILKDESEKQWLIKNAMELASRGQRVIAFAFKKSPHLSEEELQLLGLVALIDPIREEVPEAILACANAGINVVMITGDHKQTAMAIGEQIKIVNQNLIAIEGKDLLNFDYAKDLSKLRIVARANPEHKIKLVEEYVRQGHVVAMTGDGVNDAAALKQAHIGVAMGLKGTDAARESSDMILMDDNFATIVKAIEEGRRLYANILKFIKFLLIGNFSEILVVALAPFLGLGMPLSPLHILWVNLMTDSLPGIALSQGPAEAGILNQKPRHLNQPLLGKSDYSSIFVIGVITAICCLLAFVWGHQSRSEAASTLTFSVLVFSQLWISLAISSESSVLNFKIVKNQKWLLAVIAFEIAIHFLIFRVESVAQIIDGHTLNNFELLVTLGLSLIPAIFLELLKYLRRKALPV